MFQYAILNITFPLFEAGRSHNLVIWISLKTNTWIIPDLYLVFKKLCCLKKNVLKCCFETQFWRLAETTYNKHVYELTYILRA